MKTEIHNLNQVYILTVHAGKRQRKRSELLVEIMLDLEHDVVDVGHQEVHAG